MSFVFAAIRWLVARLSLVLVIVALATRVREAWRRRRRGHTERRRLEREVLPSLYDRYPDATKAPRRRVGVASVPIERVVGTMRHPSQNTADFLPLPRLRGNNWLGRWQRINRALSRLDVLPPVDLVQIGEEYYVEDGHNRVAAARQAGATEIDADVTQLIVPGVTQPGQATISPTSLVEADTVRQAGSGRYSPTVEQRSIGDTLSRRELLRDLDESP